MTELVLWLVAIIAVEAITEILTSSDITIDIRSAICDLSEFLCKLSSCGYCMSVWVSAPVAFFLPVSLTGVFAVDVIIRTFALHRLSNLWHGIMKLCNDPSPRQHVITIFRGKSDGR